MDIDRTWLWGGTGLVVGLLVGIAIAGDGREAREAARRGQEEMARTVAAVSEAVGRIDQSVAELGGRVSGIETTVAQATERQAGGVEGLRQRLEEVGAGLDGAVAELGGAVSEIGTSVTSSLGERLEGLRAALDPGGTRAGRPRASGAPAAPAPEAAPGAGEAVAIGQAVGFGDGAARLFLSGVDREAGTARVAINGPSPTSVSLGEPAEAGTCTVTLTGFTEEGATFEGECGDGGAGQAAAPAEATGAGTAVPVGAAATLVDGKLRVFLSGIDAEAGSARVAVNGPQTMSLAVGQPVEAGGCTVTLTGIGDGQATIDGQC